VSSRANVTASIVTRRRSGDPQGPGRPAAQRTQLRAGLSPARRTPLSEGYVWCPRGDVPNSVESQAGDPGWIRDSLALAGLRSD
jgi:hypothetical protein